MIALRKQLQLHVNSCTAVQREGGSLFFFSFALVNLIFMSGIIRRTYVNRLVNDMLFLLYATVRYDDIES